MKLLARLVFGAVVISIGLLSPMVQGEMPRATQQTNRCVYQITSNQCHACPSRAAASSAMQSNCCSGQTCCVVLYSATVTYLADPILTGERIGEMELHASARAQRPPVPPPRVWFS